jgi:WD40 repeat protein
LESIKDGSHSKYLDNHILLRIYQDLFLNHFSIFRIHSIFISKIISIFLIFGTGCFADNIDVNGQFLFCGTLTGKVNIWDLSTVRLDRVVNCQKSEAHRDISNIVLSPDRTVFITTSGRSEVSVLWDYSNGLRLRDLRGHDGSINDITFSTDGKYIASCSDTGFEFDLDWSSQYHDMDGTTSIPINEIKKNPSKTVILWEYNNSLKPRYLYGHKSDVNAIAFSPDNQFLITGDAEGKIILWHLTSGQPVHSISSSLGAISALAFYDSENKIVIGHDSGALLLWDFDLGIEVWKSMEKTSAIYSVGCSNDGRFVLCGYWDGTSTLSDALNGSHLKNLSNLSGPISVEFYNDSKHAIIATREGVANIYNLNSGNYLTLNSEGNEWICYTPDNFFAASRYGGQLVSIVKGLDIFSIDQFAAWYNRPDIILSSVGLGSEGLIKHYYARHKKRLDKLKLPIEIPDHNLSIPHVTILKSEQIGGILKLDFLIEEKKSDLASYNIYVNDVPYLGPYGKGISGSSLLCHETIKLSAGLNKIEVTCYNGDGVESFRPVINVNHNIKQPVDLYFLGFGISSYNDSNLDLKYAAKDIIDMGNVFQQMEGNEFHHVYTKTFLNKDVNSENILASKSFFGRANVDDILILFIAGHGLHARTDQATYYYLTYNTNINRLHETAVPYEHFEDLLQNVRARKKMFFIDTCESGDIDEEKKSKYNTWANKRNIIPRSIRGIINISTTLPYNSRQYLFENDRYIYNDLVRRSGAIVFSSCKGWEYSYENDVIQNGYFTEALLNAFSTSQGDRNSDGYLSLDELRYYVLNYVHSSTDGYQNPTVDRDNIYQYIIFPIVDN